VTAEYLDIADPAFSTRSADVVNARAQNWYARTPYGIAVLRYNAVGRLLRDRRLRQGSHNWPQTHGLKGSFAAFWQRSVIGQEGPVHRELRSIAVPVLTQDYVDTFIPGFDEIAAQLCAELAKSTSCEFQSAFAKPFAGMAIAELLGMQREDWNLVAHDATELGLAMGVSCKSFEDRFNAAHLRLEKLSEDLVTRVRKGHDTTSYVARMVARFDTADGLTFQHLLDMIVMSIFGGVDTTRGQLGLGLSLFIDNPTQWQLLRENDGFVVNAVDEIIRARPTTTWATREAVEDFTFEGVDIPKGTVLHMLVHASSRDPEISQTSDFRIDIKRKRHFGFGGGAHHCIGSLVARTDIGCALNALRKTFQTVSYDGQPIWEPDSGNTAPIHLPVRYEVDA
jgi:cytochrome P450